MKQADSVFTFLLSLSLLAPDLLSAQGTWIGAAAVPDPRQEVGTAELNGKIYVIGGLPRTDRVQEFDPVANSWRFVAPLAIAVDHTAVAAVGTKLYVIGGNTAAGATNAVFEYDPPGDRWSQKTSMPTPRSALAAAVISGKIYAVGGSGATQRELEAYDPATDSWAQLAAMPTGRNHLAAASIQGKLYVAGGRPGNLSVLEVYDPATNSWSTKAPMPTGRSGHAAAVVGNKLYAFGGEGNPASPIGIFSQAELYDPQTDSWASLDPMPTPRHGIGAAALGNRIYVPAGATRAGGGSQTGVHEVFVVQPEKLFFAHFVAGAGFENDLVVANSAESQNVVATLELRDQSGSPFEATVGGIRRGKATLVIPALGSVTLHNSDPLAPVRAGSLEISSDAPLSAVVLLSANVSALNTSPAVTRFFVPVERDPSTSLHCGIAITSTAEAATTVDLVLQNENGQEIGRRQIVLPSRGQTADFLEKIFPGADLGGTVFRGTVTGRSSAPVSTQVVLFRGSQFVGLPVSGF